MYTYIFDSPALQRTLSALQRTTFMSQFKKIKDQIYTPPGGRHFCLFCSLINLNLPELRLSFNRYSISLAT